MTNLHCSVVHCEYNQNSKCSRSGIQVDGGHEASVPHQTRCASFRERSTESQNCAHANCAADLQSTISCSANKCHYNCNGKCSAKAVQIGGTSAHRSSDTECNTFSSGGPCKTHCR